MTRVQFTGAHGSRTARTVENVNLFVTLCSARKMHRKHISQYLKFQGILEFVGRQVVALSMVVSEPATQRKTTCLFAC